MSEYQHRLFIAAAYQCSICGKALSDPESVQRGVGPICWAKKLQENESMDNDETHDDHIAEPIAFGVILRRTDSGPATNVSHVCRHHSPDGYEWGYGGSGPAELALNIVEIAIQQRGYDGPMVELWRGECSKAAWLMHQEFKWRFLVDMPREGGVIPWEKIMDWVNDFYPIDLLEEA